MPPSSTAKIRAWAQANGHAVGDRGPIPAEVSAAYHAASSGAKRPRSAKRTSARPSAATRPVTPSDQRPPARNLQPDGPVGEANTEVLVARISRLEQQVAELITRLAAAETARAVSLRRSRFGRRS